MSGGGSGQPSFRSTLADVDWKVHQVLASDKVSKIGAPLVRLQLHLKEAPIVSDPPPNTNTNTDAATREVSVELSREELDSLIAQLEVAKGALDQVKAAAV